jgi:hypothetical protein
MRSPLLLISLCAACDCGAGALVSTSDQNPTPGPQPTQPAAPPPMVTTPAGWCANDCDCGPSSRCIGTNGELIANSCQPGTNTCAKPCAVTCGAGTTCQAGACVAAPCVLASCMNGSATGTPPPGGVTVTGTYQTAYELDVHEFAGRAADVGKLLDVLTAALNGQATLCSQASSSGQLVCIASQLIANNVNAPPWVGQLVQVLAGVFRFGDAPVTAKGVMQLAESSNGTVTASETWSEMWLVYAGTSYNLMNGPTLGTNGQIKVTVKAFGGTRNFGDVVLGPRSVELDVNKLVVNLINVVITGVSGGVAHDVAELLDVVLCSQVQSVSTSQYLVCKTAAASLAKKLELETGLGGVDIDEQRGIIYDDDLDGKADFLGRASPVSARGTVKGDMSNGAVSGDLGAFPKSNWFGAR